VEAEDIQITRVGQGSNRGVRSDKFGEHQSLKRIAERKETNSKANGLAL